MKIENEIVKNLLIVNGYPFNSFYISEICEWIKNIKHFEIDKETQRNNEGKPYYCLIALDLDTPATFNTYEVYCMEVGDNLTHCYEGIIVKILMR